MTFRCDDEWCGRLRRLAVRSRRCRMAAAHVTTGRRGTKGGPVAVSRARGGSRVALTSRSAIDGRVMFGQPAGAVTSGGSTATGYRGRGGVGRAAARAAIAHRPGQWELAIARKNIAALAFWRGVAAELAAGPVDELDTTDPWNGSILRFRVAAA